MKKPNILLLDLETAPLLGYVWSLWENTLGLNQIKEDSFILSWSAKWLESEDKKIVYGPHKELMYKDQRNSKNIENDKPLLKPLWKLLNEADIVIGHNSRAFDEKWANSRFILNEMKPPSGFKSIDTLSIAKRKFKFTSNKLAYLTSKLCKKYKKSEHSKFSGFELWRQCLLRNNLAFEEMEKYNKIDVLSLEELYHILSPWADGLVNFNLFHDEDDYVCNCGSTEFQKRGYSVTQTGRFQRFSCTECGHWSRGAVNLFSKEKRASLRRKL